MIDRVIEWIWTVLVDRDTTDLYAAALITVSGTLLTWFVRPRLVAWVLPGTAFRRRIVVINAEPIEHRGNGTLWLELTGQFVSLRGVLRGNGGTCPEGSLFEGKNRSAMIGLDALMPHGVLVLHVQTDDPSANLQTVRVVPGAGWRIAPRVENICRTSPTLPIQDTMVHLATMLLGWMFGLLSCLVFVRIMSYVVNISAHVARSVFPLSLSAFLVFLVASAVILSLLRSRRTPQIAPHLFELDADPSALAAVPAPLQTRDVDSPQDSGV